MRTLEKLPKPMSREEIIEAIGKHKKGSWITVTWLYWETVLGAKRSRIAVTKTWRVRVGIKYNNMKSVIERKAKEDAAAGGSLVRRKSSYTHDKVHGFIVYDRTTISKEFLQVMVANAMTLCYDVDGTTGKKVPVYVVDPFTGKKKRKVKPVPVKMEFFENGEAITDPGLLARVKAITPKKSAKTDEDESFETFVLPLAKILNID